MSTDQTRHESARKQAEYTRDRAIQERDRAIAERDALHAAILNAHGRGLPKHWEYTDSITSIDLFVAECCTLRVELAGANERAKMLLDAKNHWLDRSATAEATGDAMAEALRAVYQFVRWEDGLQHRVDAALALVQSHAERPQSQDSQEKS